MAEFTCQNRDCGAIFPASPSRTDRRYSPTYCSPKCQYGAIRQRGMQGRWGTEAVLKIAWGTAHNRVRKLWGSAKQYTCVSCGGVAAEWAYDGTDPQERYGPSASGPFLYYSVFPEFYMPMCIPCHRRRDGLTEDWHAFRRLMRETGLTVSEIADLVKFHHSI